MFARLRAALGVLGKGPVSTGRPTDECLRCAELEGLVRYWREREERTADALLASKGVQGRVAAPPAPKPLDGLAALARGMGVTEIDTTKSKQPGQAAMTRGDREH